MTTTTLRIAMLTLGLVASSTALAELKIVGSDTLEPFFQNALSQYARGSGAGVQVKADYKGTTQGFRELCEGRATIVPASSKLEGDALARCQQSRTEFIELPIAYDAVVVIAHPSHASMGEIKLVELKTIFTPENGGKVVRWSQVRAGLPDTPLNVVSLDIKSGTTAFFGGKVHGMKGFVRHDAKVSASHQEIAKLVAADPNAIGFISIGALSESKATVWKVPVNFGNGAVVASKESILNDTYAPFSRLLYVYVAKSALQEKNSEVLAFSNWLMERASKLASYEGFVPLTDANYGDNARKLVAK